MDSGCGSVGRAVVSDTRGPQFKSSYMHNLYWTIFAVNCIEKTKNKGKRCWEWPIKINVERQPHLRKERTQIFSYYTWKTEYWRPPVGWREGGSTSFGKPTTTPKVVVGGMRKRELEMAEPTSCQNNSSFKHVTIVHYFLSTNLIQTSFNATSSICRKLQPNFNALSNKFGYCLSCTMSFVLSFHKSNRLPLRQIRTFISFYYRALWSRQTMSVSPNKFGADKSTLGALLIHLKVVMFCSLSKYLC